MKTEIRRTMNMFYSDIHDSSRYSWTQSSTVHNTPSPILLQTYNINKNIVHVNNIVGWSWQIHWQIEVVIIRKRIKKKKKKNEAWVKTFERPWRGKNVLHLSNFMIDLTLFFFIFPRRHQNVTLCQIMARFIDIVFSVCLQTICLLINILAEHLAECMSSLEQVRRSVTLFICL